MQTRNKYGLNVLYAIGTEWGDTENVEYWFPTEKIREFMADAFLAQHEVLEVKPIGMLTSERFVK